MPMIMDTLYTTYDYSYSCNYGSTMPAPHNFGGPFGQLGPISLSWTLPALILKKTRLTSEDRHMLGARRPLGGARLSSRSNELMHRQHGP
jgi:hypothetical protein